VGLAVHTREVGGSGVGGAGRRDRRHLEGGLDSGAAGRPVGSAIGEPAARAALRKATPRRVQVDFFTHASPTVPMSTPLMHHHRQPQVRAP
jgi:hypothetical protein